MFLKIVEILEGRDLIFGLAAKDLKSKYRYAAGGFGWMVVNPLAQMMVFSFVFGRIFKINIENYPFFLLCGIIPWSFLRGSVDSASNSILANAGLVKKTAFLREALPVSAVVANLVPFLAALFFLSVLSFFLNFSFNPVILWLPVIVMLQVILSVGISLIVSGLNAVYRETQFIIEILLLVWFYFTPIVYNFAIVEHALPKELFSIYCLNPMTGISLGYQSVLARHLSPDINLLIVSALVSFLVFFLGLMIFSFCERKFVDMV